MKTRDPARGGVSRDAALGMAANSDADYTAIEAAEKSTGDKLKPYEWQHAISASNLDPVTRGVLWALSLYINKRTGYAFPSLRTLSRASGYSLDAVRRHIKIALSSGWIAIDNAGLEGQE